MTMRKLTRLIVFQAFIGMILSLISFPACTPVDPAPKILIRTDSISGLFYRSCSVSGTIVYLGESDIEQYGFVWSESPDPTLDLGEYLDLGGRSDPGSFTETITELNPGTNYYVRSYASDVSGTEYGDVIPFVTGAVGTVTDYDGNVYQTVEIGEQIWMAESMRASHYADGTAIPLVEGDAAWNAVKIDDKAFCYVNNDPLISETYGSYYTWAAAMDGPPDTQPGPNGFQGVCPDGWHIPSDEEWKQLEIYLGLSKEDAEKVTFRGADEGGKLKEQGFAHWKSPNTGATNVSGFTSIPSGGRHYEGGFFETGYFAIYWAGTEGQPSDAWTYHQDFDRAESFRGLIFKNYGYSVRCVKDK